MDLFLVKAKVLLASLTCWGHYFRQGGYMTAGIISLKNNSKNSGLFLMTFSGVKIHTYTLYFGSKSQYVEKLAAWWMFELSKCFVSGFRADLS